MPNYYGPYPFVLGLAHTARARAADGPKEVMDGVLSVDEALAQGDAPEGPLGNVLRGVTFPLIGVQLRRATRCLGLSRPIARLLLCTWEDRMDCPYLRACWTSFWWDATGRPGDGLRFHRGHHRRELVRGRGSGRLVGDRLLPACTWCGTPTGGWCDTCTPSEGEPANALCSECGGCDAYSTSAQCRACASPAAAATAAAAAAAGWVRVR